MPQVRTVPPDQQDLRVRPAMTETMARPAGPETTGRLEMPVQTDALEIQVARRLETLAIPVKMAILERTDVTVSVYV